MSGTTHRPLDLKPSRPRSTEHHGAIRKALLSAGALSSLLYVITADGVAASMWDGYRRTEQMVSDLFAVGSPGREAAIPLMWLYTVLFVAFGIGVWTSAHGNRRLRIGGALLIGYGASNIAAGFFPLTLNDDASVPMHIVVTNLQLALMVAAMCSVAAAFHGRMRLYSIASLVISMVMGIVSFTAAPGPSLLLGIGERVSIGAFLLWVAVLAVALWTPPTVQRVARSSVRLAAWTVWVVFALLMLPWFGGLTFTLVVVGSAVAVSLVPGMVPPAVRSRDRADLVVIAALYVGITGLLWLAFRTFGTDQVLGLFLSFAAALILGVAGPVIYTVWTRERSLADLGLQGADLKRTAALAVLFGGVQFTLTLWGFQFPTIEDWVPLLIMALVVGVFESVFFRGFIQNRLEAQFGHAKGIGGAAALYGLYHVGYGMGIEEILFLSGLGVIYAVAFALTRSVLVLWPLLTPLGSFFANVRAGDIELPWASIAGFLDVLGVMLLVVWLAHRHVRRRATPDPAAPTPVSVA